MRRRLFSITLTLAALGLTSCVTHRAAYNSKSPRFDPSSIDAKWSNYGVYLQRMIETVQIQWDRILLSSTLYPPSGTTVTVKFRMDSDGKITAIVDVKNTSNEQGKEACISAITARSPYGKWSDDMIAVLGDSQEMTFTFYYQ